MPWKTNGGNGSLTNARTLATVRGDREMEECMSSCLSVNKTGKVCRSYIVRRDGKFCSLKGKRPGEDSAEVRINNLYWVLRRPDWYLGECNIPAMESLELFSH